MSAAQQIIGQVLVGHVAGDVDAIGDAPSARRPPRRRSDRPRCRRASGAGADAGSAIALTARSERPDPLLRRDAAERRDDDRVARECRAAREPRVDSPSRRSRRLDQRIGARPSRSHRAAPPDIVSRRSASSRAVVHDRQPRASSTRRMMRPVLIERSAEARGDDSPTRAARPDDWRGTPRGNRRAAAATAWSAQARAPDAAARRAARPGRGSGRGRPTCSRGRRRCPAETPSGRRAAGGASRRNRARWLVASNGVRTSMRRARRSSGSSSAE